MTPSPFDGGGLGWGWFSLSDPIEKLAKDLRKNPTDAEKALWRQLRSKQMGDLKFRRQEPIGRYIVDFVCYERRLIREGN